MQRGRVNPENAPITPVAVSVFIEKNQFVFRTDDGRPIYTSEKDEVGKSNCTGACATTWLPVEAAADASKLGDWTVVIRADKVRQWAYKGKPVYSFADDVPGSEKGVTQPGWHALRL